MMSLKEALSICLKQKYATISGRATRAEYWWFTLFVYIIFVIMYAIMLIMAAYIKQGSGAQILGALLVVGLMSIISLLLIVPSICVTVRRLHDIGYSGWWVLLDFIPIARFVVLVFTLMPSQPSANEYGDNPQEQEFYAI